jgi:hypothetical protein
MLIVSSKGRVGNQLFIFSAALKARKPKERILMIGFAELKQLINPLSVDGKLTLLNIPQGRMFFLLERIVVLLGWVRLFSLVLTAAAGPFREESILRLRRGIFPVSIFRAGYCQEESLVSAEPIRALRDLAYESEGRFLGLMELGHLRVPRAQKFCFVHVRRRDYLEWPTIDFPADLPARWYLRQMEAVRLLFPNVQFLIFSDDLNFCEAVFGDLRGVAVIDATGRQAWLAMSACDSGILSASSFSWWAGKIASLEREGPFIAPDYWFGWRKESWEGIPLRGSSFITWERV